MKIKTKMLLDQLARIISEWPGVECISLNETALPDTLDPYFALILDIYYDGTIPSAEERCKLYGEDVAVFESSSSLSRGRSGESKDRFLIRGLPVHLEYKPLSLIDERVSIADKKLDSFWLIKDSGTYGFYRLARNEIIFSRNDWIKGIRERIENFSDEFWRLMRNAHESKMDHFLSDLGAAAINGDDFNCLISAAGFIKNACLSLFCVNQCFEPSHKAYFKQVLDLPILPQSFSAEFQTFVRQDKSMTMGRRYELAKLIAKRIVAL